MDSGGGGAEEQQEEGQEEETRGVIKGLEGIASYRCTLLAFKCSIVSAFKTIRLQY